MVFEVEKRSPEEIAQDKYKEFRHQMTLAHHAIMTDFGPYFRSSPPQRPALIEQVIRDFPGDMLTQLAQPLPGIWTELGRRAAAVTHSPKEEYDFLQSVGTEAMLHALQYTLLTLKLISENAPAIQDGIKFLSDAGCPYCEQTLAALTQLLAAVNQEILTNQ